MNTRTYSRNSMLAFPKTCEYACAVQRPYDREDRVVMWACLAAVAAIVLVMVFTG